MDEIVPAARDIFDLAPSEVGVRPEPAPEPPVEGPVWSLPWTRLTIVGVLTVGIALAFSFPTWAFASLPVAAVASLLLRKWRVVRRVAWTAVTAAFAAQMTDVFITLFTWPLRFGFFFVMVGALVIHWGLGMDEY